MQKHMQKSLQEQMQTNANQREPMQPKQINATKKYGSEYGEKNGPEYDQNSGS